MAQKKEYQMNVLYIFQVKKIGRNARYKGQDSNNNHRFETENGELYKLTKENKFERTLI